MARRHHPLLPAVLTCALVLGACSSEDSVEPADLGDTAAAPTPSTSAQGTTAAPADTGEEAVAEPESEPTSQGEELFPDVLDATASQAEDGTWTVSATLSSPYDSPARYADAWRVVGSDGTEYGIRVLTHDHASEQPFTRSHDGIEIPDGVTIVTIQGRDQVSGWGGGTFDLVLAPATDS